MILPLGFEPIACKVHAPRQTALLCGHFQTNHSMETTTTTSDSSDYELKPVTNPVWLLEDAIRKCDLAEVCKHLGAYTPEHLGLSLRLCNPRVNPATKPIAHLMIITHQERVGVLPEDCIQRIFQFRLFWPLVKDWRFQPHPYYLIGYSAYRRWLWRGLRLVFFIKSKWVSRLRSAQAAGASAGASASASTALAGAAEDDDVVCLSPKRVRAEDDDCVCLTPPRRQVGSPVCPGAPKRVRYTLIE